MCDTKSLVYPFKTWLLRCSPYGACDAQTETIRQLVCMWNTKTLQSKKQVKMVQKSLEALEPLYCLFNNVPVLNGTKRYD